MMPAYMIKLRDNGAIAFDKTLVLAVAIRAEVFRTMTRDFFPEAPARDGVEPSKGTSNRIQLVRKATSSTPSASQTPCSPLFLSTKSKFGAPQLQRHANNLLSGFYRASISLSWAPMRHDTDGRRCGGTLPALSLLHICPVSSPPHHPSHFPRASIFKS